MGSSFRAQLEAWARTIDVKADRVLDIGGAQNPIEGRTKSWDVMEYNILDLPQPHETKRKPDREQDIQSHGHTTLEQEYGIVFCLEVMEYLWDPCTAMMNISLELKKGGTLYVSFPFIYPHHNPTGEDCLRYTKWGVEKILNEAGFTIESIESRLATGPGAEMLQAFFSNEGMKRSKEYKSHNDIGYMVKAVKK